MRIVSLLPSATEIVFALGLGDELVGRTHECDWPPEAADVPVMTASVGGHPEESSRQVHERVTAAVHGGSSIYRLDEEALRAAQPDLVLTQELCTVCAVSYREVGNAARAIDGDVRVVSLEPRSIEGILHTISTVGAYADAEDEAVGLVELVREHLAAIESRVAERRATGTSPRRVVLLEWLDPPFAAGHWVPEQVRRAGGWELLGHEGEPSRETTWEQVREVDPDALVLIPCGFDALRAANAWASAPLPEWVRKLRAVRSGEVHALNGSAYFSRPGPRVIDGVALLAQLFDPGGFREERPPDAWVPLGA